MADEEVIGGVAIAVTGDFSDLDAAFEAAVSKAVSEGATLAEAIQSAMVVPDASGIADAFGQVGAAATNAATQLGLFDEAAHVDYSDATGQLNLFATELEPIGAAANTAAAGLGALGDDVTTVGGAAGGAAAPVDQFAQSAEHAGEAAHEAEGGLGGMAEQLLAFGEALAVTEALKEFGEEALHAYDSMQKATNSLTALTGSAETAKEVIEGIEAIAKTQPFSFPELAGAAQKMAAFGIEAEKIPELLAAAGNASRATGNSFDGIASALERVSITGAVTGKQLVQLGVNWDDLAKAAGRSVADTQALLKKGGQDAAADLDLLLKTVEDKFGNFAKVPLTIGEQWIVLQNQMHTVFADIGEALAPTIQRIVDIIQTDLIPAVKTATEWFKSLPEPVRDAAVAFGLAVAALAPIAVALAGAALAITGITEAVEIAGVAFEALAGGLGVASLALSEILIPLAAIGIAIAAIHFSGLDTEASKLASNLRGDFEGIADLFSGLTQSVGNFFSSLASGIETALKPFTDGISSAWKVLADGVGSAIHPATEAVGSFWSALTSTAAEIASAAFGKVQEGLDLVAQKAQPATEALGRVKEVLTDTSAKQEVFFAGVSAGAPQLESLAQGLTALSNALDFLGGHYQTLTDAMTKGNPVMKENADRMHEAGQAAMEAAGLFEHHALATAALTTATQKLYDEQTKANDKLADAKQIMEAVRADYQAGEASASDLARAVAEYEKAQKAANVQTEASRKALTDAKDAAKEFAKEVKDANEILQQADNILAKLPADTQAYLSALADGGKNAKQIWDEVSSLIQKASDKTSSLKGEPLTAVRSMIEALKELKQPLLDFADAGEFSKISTALGDLDAKVGGLKQDTLNMFNGLLSQLAEIPGSVATNGGALIKWIQQVASEDEKLDKQQQTTQKTFDKAWDKYVQDTQTQVIPITATLQERLAGIDVTFQGLQKDSSHLWDTSAIGDYLSMVKQMNAEGLKTAQQQESQIATNEKLLDEMVRMHQGLGEILEIKLKIGQEELALGESQGANVEGQILGIEKIKLEQESLRIETHGLADTYVGLINNVLNGFDNMEKAVADNIVDGKNWGEVWDGILKSFAKTILETVIKGALEPLKDSLLKLIGQMLPDLKNAFGDSKAAADKLYDAFVKQANGADLSTAADATLTAANTATAASSTVTGASLVTLGISAQLASISMYTMIGAIAGIVGAVAGIVGDIYLAAIDTKLFHVNTALLSIFNETVNRRKDAWDQYNGIYDRLGECKNDLDALVAAASKTGSASAPGDLKGDLDIIATDANLLVVGIQNIANTLLAMAGADNLMVLGLQNINSTTYALHDDLGVVIGKLDTIISSILYGGRTNDQSLSALARATQEGSNQVEGAVRQASALQLGGSAADREGRAREAALAEAAAQQALTLARQQYAAATSIAAQVAALKAQVAADNQLAMLAERQGNTTLAASYTSDANRIQQDIVALIPQIGTVVSSVNNVAGTTAAGASAVSIAATNAGVLVAAAVGSAAAYIASSVSAAVAAVASFAPTGGGQYQYVPPRGTPTYQQGSESQHPGNSNSPGGNTGTSGSSGPGGYTSTGQRTSTIPPPVTPPKYDPMYNADGTPFTGNAGARTPPPFDPLNPNTWNQSTSYDEGGYVPHDMMAKVHAGEWVLPPDVTGMLRQMASNPTGDFGMLNPGGGGGQAGNQTNIFHVYAPSPREAAQQIATYMKTQSRKMAILSS